MLDQQNYHAARKELHPPTSDEVEKGPHFALEIRRWRM